MARTCEICGKGHQVGMNVSHSKRRTKRLFHSNIQRVRISKNGGTAKIYVCTRCLRLGKVKKA